MEDHRLSHYRTAVQQNGAKPVKAPDPEVRPAPRRRTFTAEYKLRILAEADRSSEPGAIGALLRREGLYSSHLTEWRRQRAAGELKAGVTKVRGRKPAPEAQEVARLQRENERLRAQLVQAELIIGAQKKLAQALEHALSDQNGPS
jgi:transposase-like protein